MIPKCWSIDYTFKAVCIGINCRGFIIKKKKSHEIWFNGSGKEGAQESLVFKLS